MIGRLVNGVWRYSDWIPVVVTIPFVIERQWESVALLSALGALVAGLQLIIDYANREMP